MRKVLVIIPHADDASLFVGGALRLMANEGHELHLVRITNDDADSVGRSRAETIERNRIETEEAYAVLGVTYFTHLGYESDVMAEVPYLELREKLIRIVRRLRPYTIISFDIDGLDEENMDHVRTAQAVAETCWTASFDLHHPEHFDEGLAPYSVPERLFFARNPVRSNRIIDISSVIDIKIEAVLKHRVVMENFIHQIRMQAESFGLEMPALRDRANEELVAGLIRRHAQLIGEAHNIEYAERLYDKGKGLLELLG